MKSFTLLLLSTCLFFQCSPKPIHILQLQETEVETYWVDGQQIGLKSACGIDVHLTYSHTDENKNIIFDMVFQNNSEESYLVDVSEISLTNVYNKQISSALEPEEEILNYRLKESKVERNRKVNTAIAATALVATTAAIISSGGYNDRDYYYPYANNLNINVENQQPLYTSFKNMDIASLNSEALPCSDNRFFWEAFTLRKTTLLPEYQLRGLVVFEDYPALRKFDIEVPVCDNESVSFSLHKKVIKP